MPNSHIVVRHILQRHMGTYHMLRKLISKADCQKLRQSSKTRDLYPVKRYYYYSKTHLAVQSRTF
jgi:hypothetical protein